MTTTTVLAAPTSSPTDMEAIRAAALEVDDVRTVLATVGAVVARLDTANGRGQLEVTHRILKLAEETGEAAQAWIGATGANPRKGTTHTLHQVAEELADVAITALVAIASLDLDPATVLAGKARVVAARLANKEVTVA